MAISLKNKNGQTIASIEHPTNIFGLTDDVAAQVQKIVVDWLDKRHKKRSATGYVTKTELDQYNLSSVPIPANFAGLEAVAVPTRLQYQYFVITDVEEEDDGVTVTAQHVFYELLNNSTNWEPTEDTEYTGAAVCRNVMTNALSPETRFSVASDCTDTIKGSELDYARKNIVQAFLDPESGICKKYGLSLIRDNWDFYCLKNVGYDRGFVVEDGKNLLGVTRSVSIENTRTRIAPIAKGGDGKVVWLDYNNKKYIDSQHIGNYPSPRLEVYDTGLQIGKNGVTTENVQEKLLEAAQKLFDDEHVDDPEITMTVDFLSIGDTEEYAQYRDLDKVYLYDIITIKDKVRGYNYSAQVIGVEHDILTGQLTSVTIGSLNNWDGVRKIASWQVPEVNGANIRLQSILAGSFADGAILNSDLADGAVSIIKINAAAINQLHADSADIADARIRVASIGYVQIKDANIENLIARDAVTDRYFIDKLSVRNAQMVQATVGELVIKASNNKYYRLDVASNGSLSPTEVTLTSAEIAAGVTSNGHAAIIETDLTVGDLSASNMKGINALIDKLTASRINVDELFARTATINELNAWDIRGNNYLRLAVNRSYSQWADPASTASNNVQDGDIWNKDHGLRKWSDFGTLKWSELPYPWSSFESGKQYIRKNGAWEQMNDPTGKYSIISGIEIIEPGVEISGRKYVRIRSGGSFLVDSGNFSIDQNGNVKMSGTVEASAGKIGGWEIGTDKLSSGSGTSYVQMAVSGDYAFMAGNSDELTAPFRVKRDGTVYLKKLITLTEQGGETVVDLQNYPFWKLYYHTIKSYTASSITLSNGAVINFNSAAQTYLDSEWVGNVFNYYVKDQDDQVILSGSVTLTPSPPQTGTGDTWLTNFSNQHKMVVNVRATGIQGAPLFQWNIDASGEYQSGYDTGYAAGWAAAKALINIDHNKIEGPSDTVDGLPVILYTVTVNGWVNSIVNNAPGYYTASGEAHAYIDGADVASAGFTKTVHFS